MLWSRLPHRSDNKCRLLWLLASVLALLGLCLSPVLADQQASREEIARELALVANYPNPFNADTTISYKLLRSAQVTVDVYDLNGRHVVNLIDEVQSEGINFAIWKTATAASGTYIFRLKAEGISVFRKMCLVK